MTAFLVIGGVGLALLFVSFVAGEFLHGVFSVFDSDLVSTSAVAGFVAAFGFTGALVVPGLGVGWAIGAGLAAGLGVAAGVGTLTKMLMKGGDEATVRREHLVGLTGSVITAIPGGGFGQVNVTVAGHITVLNARSEGPIPAGTAVSVVAVLSPTSVQVARVASDQPDTGQGDQWPWGPR